MCDYAGCKKFVTRTYKLYGITRTTEFNFCDVHFKMAKEHEW